METNENARVEENAYGASLPLRPRPESSVGPVVTFAASAALGLGIFLIATVPRSGATRGATRSSRLRRLDREKQVEALERLESGGP